MLKLFRATLFSVATLVMSMGTAWADPVDDAQAITTDVSSRIVSLIQSGGTADTKRDDLRDILIEFGEMDTVARVIMGVSWRTASEAQQAAFQDAVTSYLAGKYVKMFGSYEGQTIHIKRAEDLGRKGILVYAEAINPNGGETIKMDWRFSAHTGSVKLVDIIVEGISMLSTEREVVGQLLDKSNGDVDALIAELR